MLACLVMSVLYFGYWVGPSASSILVVKDADYILQTPQVASKPAVHVSLPHEWPEIDTASGVAGVYRITLPTFETHHDWAVSVSDYMPNMEITLAGEILPQERLTGHIGQVAFARLGTVEAKQVIEFRVPQHFSFQGGIGKIRIGPVKLLKRQALIISIARELSHLWSVGITLVVFVVSLGVYWFRREPFLLALSYSTAALSLRLALPYILGYWSNDGLELAIYLFSSLNVIVGLSFMVLLATEKNIGKLVPFILLCLTVIASIIFSQTGSLEFRRGIGISFSLIFGAITFALCWRELLVKRYWILLAILTLALIRFCVVTASFIVHHGQFGYADNNNQTLITPLAILAAILIGSRHVYAAFKNYELINGQLRHEVEAYKMELVAGAEREKAMAAEQAAANERIHWMQEIHDGLGSHLISARFIADKASSVSDIKKVKNSIDDGIEELRELVESLSPEKSTVPSILGAMRYRLKARFESAGIKMRWDVDPMIEAAEITAKQALSVQRIAQEALSNVLKHSQARTVNIHIFTQENSIVVRIEDDGRGFIPNETSSGRGIANLKRRAQECNGEISWIAMHPGTRIELRLQNY